MDIDVRYEADHEAPAMVGTRPQLTWGEHPTYGRGWTLWYADDPNSETFGVEEHFMAGDLVDVAEVVDGARKWLALRRA